MRLALVFVLVVLVGCAPRGSTRSVSVDDARSSYAPWSAQPADIQQAERLAKEYVFAVLSDDAIKGLGLRTPPCNRQAAVEAGVNLEGKGAPDDFTVQGRRFSKYVTKHNACLWNGNKQIVVSYFDPETFPDWRSKGGMHGGFPAYFTVTVDLTRGQVAEHSAYPY